MGLDSPADWSFELLRRAEGIGLTPRLDEGLEPDGKPVAALLLWSGARLFLDRTAEGLSTPAGVNAVEDLESEGLDA